MRKTSKTENKTATKAKTTAKAAKPKKAAPKPQPPKDLDVFADFTADERAAWERVAHARKRAFNMGDDTSYVAREPFWPPWELGSHPRKWIQPRRLEEKAKNAVKAFESAVHELCLAIEQPAFKTARTKWQRAAKPLYASKKWSRFDCDTGEFVLKTAKSRQA